MSNKPRIYVSSTIYDFSDLRSALKYWLEELDFEVQMSEFNDFEVNLDLNSFQACLDSIKNCDYFILLIGGRRGAFFDKKNKISITQQEYRTAYELVKKGEIKIISFIRKSVWDVKEDRKSLNKSLKDKNINKVESKIIEEDPEFIFQFIDEVRCAVEIKNAIEGKVEYPINNWIYLFDNFKDIFDALKVHLNLTGDLREKAIKCNLKDELLKNFLYSGVRIKEGKYTGDIVTILNIKNLIDLDNFKNQIKLENKIFKTLCKCSILLRCEFSSWALKEAIKSGIFLEYNKDIGEYKVGKTQSLFLRLNYYIEKIENIFNSDIIKISKDYLMNTLKSGERLPDNMEITIDFVLISGVFITANLFWNIYQISTCMLDFLRGIKPRKIELYPSDIFSKSDKEIIEI